MDGKRFAGAIGAIALATCALTTNAQAEDKLTYSFTLLGVSDYMFRGISYNDETPTLQSNVELGYNIFYVGAWATHIDFVDIYGPWEVDYYVSMRPTTGPISWDLTAFYYTYGSKDKTYSTWDLNYFEFKLGASTNLTDKLTVGAAAYYTPEQDVAIVDTKSIEGTASYALPKVGVFSPSVSGLVGWTTAKVEGYFLGEKDYTYWNAGLGVSVENFFMDFRYWDTTINDDLADARFVFSAGVALP